MGLDAYKITRHHRTAAALMVLCESGEVNSPDRACSLKAMWEGWREVMRIKLGASIYSECRERKRRRPE